ncbi:COP9 signalosome complex subunit 6 like protein [Argiope bruennichi]|uniref:COP9 signalosome complex subunit 6 n=1 Tax=Argiope bruennichi TaxID=94029 RepID=A0A8T0EYF7_ARGBR|nr:COP9 signalosome complex subunit 6 like protein [Argiope bruennichi]
MSMEVDEAIPKNVLAAPGTTGSVTISLHPLVIMNISEHWTRVKAQEGTPQQVIGALIGKQEGRNIEIMNSFELVFDRIEGDIVIDKDYYTTKEQQFAMMRMTGLPVSIYESVIDLVSGEATMLFVELIYTLATEEAERIGLDHMARMSTNESGESSLVAEQLQAQHSAIKMLHSRVHLILDYVRAVKQGKVAPNHEILREAYSLCHRLPVISTETFRQEYFNQCNDVGLMTYLGTLTKGCNTINQYVNKFNILYDRQGMGRRMKGFFF